MLFFHLPTALIIVGLLYLIMPAVAWLALSGQRSTPILMWCAGGGLAGLAAIMTGQLSDHSSTAFLAATAGIFITSHFMRIQSLRMELGMAWRVRWVVLGWGMSMLTVLMLIGWYTPLLRALFVTAVTVVSAALLSSLAWRIGQKEHSRNALWIASVYGLSAFAFACRLVDLMSHSMADVTIPAGGWSSQFLLATFLLSSVVGHVGYVGLALDRSKRRELMAIEARARDEERRHLGAQMAHLDRQRSLGELSASLAHELTQPLSAVLTNAQVAQRGLGTRQLDEAVHLDLLGKVIHNTQRASQIIDRIRRYIQPSAPQHEVVDVTLLARNVAELLADEARSHHVTFDFSQAAAPVWVQGDALGLSQIMLNAMKNAIEAMAADGAAEVPRREIHVSCRCAGGWACLQIRDSGPGLAAGVVPQIGTPFFTTKLTGLGMGISISRAIATQHGGSLSLSNASEGQGAVVDLTLPALAAATVAPGASEPTPWPR